MWTIDCGKTCIYIVVFKHKLSLVSCTQNEQVITNFLHTMKKKVTFAIANIE